IFFFFSSRRRHTRSKRDWSSDVCSSDLIDFLYHPPMFKVTDTHQAATWLLHEKVDQEVEKEIENILLTGEEDEKPLSQKVLGNKILEVMEYKQHLNAVQKNEVRAVDGVS